MVCQILDHYHLVRKFISNSCRKRFIHGHYRNWGYSRCIGTNFVIVSGTILGNSMTGFCRVIPLKLFHLFQSAPYQIPVPKIVNVILEHGVDRYSGLFLFDRYLAFKHRPLSMSESIENSYNTYNWRMSKIRVSRRIPALHILLKYLWGL